MTQYLVIGKSGQLAKELNISKNKKEVIFLGRDDIDLLSEESLTQTLDKFKPKIIINASAYTNVDKAEIEVEMAYALNRDAVKYLSKYSKAKEIHFIHISTDFVFDGEASQPYEINDKTIPINIYGKSKLAGERAIKEIMVKNFSIIRTSWLYSCFGSNFVKTMIGLMNSKKELSIVSDQTGCPTYARGLSEFIWNVSSKPPSNKVHHWSDIGAISWYDFSKEIYRIGKNIGLIKQDVKLSPILASEYPTLAKRPKFSCLKSIHSNSNLWNKNLEYMLKELHSMPIEISKIKNKY
jgi:dTDP-4-dehydrorhamnose reductase